MNKSGRLLIFFAGTLERFNGTKKRRIQGKCAIRGRKKRELHLFDSVCNLPAQLVASGEFGRIGLVKNLVPIVDGLDSGLFESLGDNFYCATLSAVRAKGKPDLFCRKPAGRTPCR